MEFREVGVPVELPGKFDDAMVEIGVEDAYPPDGRDGCSEEYPVGAPDMPLEGGIMKEDDFPVCNVVAPKCVSLAEIRITELALVALTALDIPGVVTSLVGTPVKLPGVGTGVVKFEGPVDKPVFSDVSSVAGDPVECDIGA